jgi:hypothetical protein
VSNRRGSRIRTVGDIERCDESESESFEEPYMESNGLVDLLSSSDLNMSGDLLSRFDEDRGQSMTHEELYKLHYQLRVEEYIKKMFVNNYLY